jgi:hypothetical protein
MLTDKEQKLVALYEKRLALPRNKFILQYGVLSWGVPVGIMVSIINMVIGDKTFDDWWRKDLWISLFSFMLSGILFGVIIRFLMQKQLKKLRVKKNG